MSYAEQIADRGALTERPASYAGLLLQPLTAPGAVAGASYPDWEFDHAKSMRFYVGGYRWFMRATGMYDLSKLSDYGDQAVKLVATKTQWAKMPETSNDWGKCSINQFRAAKNATAQHFSKAALVIAACECVLIEKIEAGAINEGTPSVADLYTNMSIIPAVWSIADFNAAYLSKLIQAEGGLADRIVGAADQTSKDALTQLAAGHTVTKATAEKIKGYIEANTELGCGVATARASKKTRSAAPGELVDVS